MSWVNFKCPQCGGSHLVEVVEGVTQITEVDALFEPTKHVKGENPSWYPEIQYGEVEYSTDFCEGVQSYKCRDCSFTLTTDDEWNDWITDEYDLQQWLKKNGMLEG